MLVVGAGEVATTKIEGLLSHAAKVKVVAPEATARVLELASCGVVELARRTFCDDDLEGIWYAVCAATPGVSVEVAHACGVRGVFLNAADDIDASSAILPAIYRDLDVTVAVSTGGRAPAGAVFVRDLVAEALGPNVGRLIAMISKGRDNVKARRIPHSVWKSAPFASMLEALDQGQHSRAEEIFSAWLSSL